MKRISLLTIMLLLTLSACVAQNQSVTLQKDSIPAATIVPALQPAAGVRDTISENATIESRMTRTERRTKRAEDYAFKIDSLIATRAFAFYPTLMQAVPGGEMRQVYANYFYAYISPVDLENIGETAVQRPHTCLAFRIHQPKVSPQITGAGYDEEHI